MIARSLLSPYDLHLDRWPLLGGRAYCPYATAPIMTLRPCGLDLLNDIDLQIDRDLDF